MQHILVIGAGRSSSYLIDYLLEHAQAENWHITVADVSLQQAQERCNNHKSATAISLNIDDQKQREEYISNANLVVSMLPAFMHGKVAADCLKFKKHLVTASYVSDEMKSFGDEAKNNGLVFLNEMGLDPGIDHASAKKIIDDIHAQGGTITSFKSYCGGLIAPESNNNPWGYKFTWNPRNVVLAGQGTARFLEDGNYKFTPYNRLFTTIETISIQDHRQFEGYTNRDSLSYRESYNLETIKTMVRGTLRMPGFCEAWNVFVKLGLTDDTYKIPNSENLTYKQFIKAYLPKNGSGNMDDQLKAFMGNELSTAGYEKINWLNLFNDKPIGLKDATPAQILQQLLEEKWKLGEHDKDMIVMQHLFEYIPKGSAETKRITSSLVVTGKDKTYTAMAKTVGLPAAIGVKLILQGKIKSTGVLIPTIKEIYEPLLEELKMLGVNFKEIAA